MITVKFEPGQKTAQASGLWQYDKGQVLRIEGLDLPRVVEVDFSLFGSGSSIPITGKTEDGVTQVSIPDSLLAAGKSKDYAIQAYVYLIDNAAGKTTHKIAINVQARPSRQGQETPTAPDQFADAVGAVQDAADRAEYAMAMAESDVGVTRQMLEETRDYVEAEKASFVGYGKRESGIRYANALTATAEGAGRAEAQDAWEAPLLDLQMAGKSVQMAEPTPEVPQPIKGVGEGGSVEVTSRSKNLFDRLGVAPTNPGISTIKLTVNGAILSNTTERTYVDAKYKVKLKPNTTYTLSGDITSLKAKSAIGIKRSIDGGNSYVGTLYASFSATSPVTGLKTTFTTDENEHYAVCLFCTYDVAEIGATTFENIQLEEGNTATSWHPYRSQTAAIPLEPLHSIGGVRDTICCRDGEWGGGAENRRENPYWRRELETAYNRHWVCGCRLGVFPCFGHNHR